MELLIIVIYDLGYVRRLCRHQNLIVYLLTVATTNNEASKIIPRSVLSWHINRPNQRTVTHTKRRLIHICKRHTKLFTYFY